MTISTGPVRPLILVFAALIGLAAAAGRAPAASTFDGQWSVLIITEAGTCDRAYRYPVQGRRTACSAMRAKLASRFPGAWMASGKINATVQRGEQSANGSGQLSSSSGSGKWTGKS